MTSSTKARNERTADHGDGMGSTCRIRRVTEVMTSTALVALRSFVAERYEYGRADGYATGFNTTCQLRITIVKGDCDDKHYTKGYNDGYRAGAVGCIEECELRTKERRGRRRD
jgi:hypothetical protein